MEEETKKILIVSRSFYPSNTPRAFRTTELVKEFARQGHDVTLITSKVDEHHIPFEKDHGITIEDWGELKFSDINTSASNPVVRIGRRVVRRALNLFLEYPDIQLIWKVKRALKNKKDFDLLISIAVPHPIHWGVAMVWNGGQKIAKTWVADCGDPYIGERTDTFRKMFYFRFFENMFLKKADYITVPFKEMKESFNETYRHKFEVIPQGFRFDEEELPTYTKNTVPTFIYSGTIIPGGRDPFLLIDYLLENEYDFKFIIYTRQSHLFSKYKNVLGKKLFIKDYIPRDELLKELAKADFLVNVNIDYDKGVLHAIPSKLIDYTLSGRPILSYQQSNLPTEIIKNFLKGDYSNKYDGVDLERYRIENVCEQFLELHRKKFKK